MQNLSYILEKTTVKHNDTHEIWASVSFTLKKDPCKKELSSNYIVVIDKSGSMEGESITTLLATIEYLIERLDEKDKMCLLTFNESTDIVLPLMNVVNKKTFTSKLSDIVADGTTNISDALLSAIEIAEKIDDHSHILLLTDGQSNNGLTKDELLKKLKDMNISSKISLHTFGLGDQHDDLLLENLANAIPGGAYYYIKDKEYIPSSFGSCLAGIKNQVAFNISFDLLAYPGCHILEMYTRFPYKKIGEKYSIKMGGLYAEETRTLLCKLLLDKGSYGESKILNVKEKHEDEKFNMSYDEKDITIKRGDQNLPFEIPLELDRHVNIFCHFISVINKIYILENEDIIKLIYKNIEIISNSPSADRCKDILADLEKIRKNKKLSTGLMSSHSQSRSSGYGNYIKNYSLQEEEKAKERVTIYQNKYK